MFFRIEKKTDIINESSSLGAVTDLKEINTLIEHINKSFKEEMKMYYVALISCVITFLVIFLLGLKSDSLEDVAMVMALPLLFGMIDAIYIVKRLLYMRKVNRFYYKDATYRVEVKVSNKRKYDGNKGTSYYCDFICSFNEFNLNSVELSEKNYKKITDGYLYVLDAKNENVYYSSKKFGK